MKINKRKRKNTTYKERLQKKINDGLRLEDEILFGKYKGLDLRRVIDIDPPYVNWAVITKVFKLDKEATYYYKCKFTEYVENIERERAQKQRRQEKEEQKQYRGSQGFGGHGSWNDFFSQFHNYRSSGQRTQSQPASIDKKKIHPAYAFDNLPARERYGKILRLQGKVTKEYIRSQYRKLALIFHPDKCIQLDEVLQTTATIMFLKVKEAYEYFQKEYNL